MKNRVKGLLALCLAMCMVLAMTTVAFGVEYSEGDARLSTWTVLQPEDTVKAYCGLLFVVDEHGNYMPEINTEANGASKVASSSSTTNNQDRRFFGAGDVFEIASLDQNYTYYAMSVVIANNNNNVAPIYYFYNDTGYRSIIYALMLKAVPKTYTVIFDTNGGSELADKTVEYGSAVLSGVTAPTKAGYTFAGWKYGDLEIADDTLYSDLAADTVASITLVAQWEVSSGHEPIRRQHVVAVVEPVTEPETETTTVDSPKTFDAGVAVYAGLSLLSAAGTAVVIGRKKEF